MPSSAWKYTKQSANLRHLCWPTGLTANRKSQTRQRKPEKPKDLRVQAIHRCSSRLFHSNFFNDTAPTEIYTLSLHDALPIYGAACTISGCPTSPPAVRRSASMRETAY